MVRCLRSVERGSPSKLLPFAHPAVELFSHWPLFALETEIRQSKLSRRQLCKNLMVDPSAWSRWTANGVDSAPPRVYQALALLLNDQNTKPLELSRVKAEIESKQEALSLGWKLILILNTMAIFYLFVRSS